MMRDGHARRTVRPRLLLLEHEVARRLEAVAALAAAWDVVPVAEGEDPLRVARTRRPDVAILSVHPRRPDVVFRLCRTLRTDVRPVPRVAIVDRTGAPRDPTQVLDLWLADGYLAGPTDVARFVEFVDAVARGDRPVVAPDAPHGALTRLLRRLKAR